jgi:uncharacterized membrane protein YqjE
MVTGLIIVFIGLLILIYPQILVAMFSGLLILFGLGMMAASWQFRRIKRRSNSQFINWIVRY